MTEESNTQLKCQVSSFAVACFAPSEPFGMGTGIPEAKTDPVVLYTCIHIRDPLCFVWKIVEFLLFWFFKQYGETVKIPGKSGRDLFSCTAR